MKPSTSHAATAVPASTSDEQKPIERCVAEGCKNMAVTHPEWDNEYCSVDCCYNHCKNTFKAWLEANKAAKIKMDVASEECTAGPSK